MESLTRTGCVLMKPAMPHIFDLLYYPVNKGLFALYCSRRNIPVGGAPRVKLPRKRLQHGEIRQRNRESTTFRLDVSLLAGPAIEERFGGSFAAQDAGALVGGEEAAGDRLDLNRADPFDIDAEFAVAEREG